MSKSVLYIASQSPARQRLLKSAGISFNVLAHGSDENIAYQGGSFSDYVLAIAQSKMHAVILPSQDTVNINDLFVLTADTLARSTKTNEILGKPIDRKDGLRMLALERQAPVEVITGCCLEKKRYVHGVWQLVEHQHWTTSSMVEFVVDEASVDDYLTRLPGALHCAGSAIIEDHGLAYLKSINGSFSAVMGLPLYELRVVLRQMGFEF